ncbi:hypothetical protein K505DRAFT_284791 [Melanomma pulvis-pyrius CBS 109.77]|uniref:Protein kinase domain-containing protein n=1 Tax=Melanomma pulvis-pyrius CBS 109.77 TaxID=1314802 RepID=A0A6A6WYQ1_9PLEO|nr:hypothetical protein K505DRAFT_284791 [Melanomma pulvis-pyrius CBS 109.77]
MSMERRILGTDFKKELIQQMTQAQNKNGLTRGYFITDEFLQKLFTKENVKEHLKKHLDFVRGETEKMSQMAESISKCSRKLYAILVLIDKPERIKQLLGVAPPVNDITLFAATQEGFLSFCSIERLKKTAGLSDIADEFNKTQWYFPPLLSSDEILSFPPTWFMFPFTSKPQPKGYGGFGAVMEAEIAKGYLHYPGLELESKIAYKKIVKFVNHDQEWEKLKDEVRVLQMRPHEHITPLLASFTAGLEIAVNPDYSQQCMYMISPLALMDMETWMEKEPDYLKGYNDDELRHHIYFDAMLGLISGLTHIHREIKGVVGYHRDLKPKNILLFERPKWTWKICDFGCANLKPVDDTGTANFVTTPYWAPPELFRDKDSTNGHTHGRSHDVFSLGCVFLLLATMLKYRWTPLGLEKFKKARGDSNLNGEKSDLQPENHAFHNSMDEVRKWIQSLDEHARREDYQKVLNLIGEMLLPREERIFAWEVEVDLYGIIDSGRSEEDCLNRLKNTIQHSRQIDINLIHNPVTRARKRGRSNAFLNVLQEARWYERSPHTTQELEKRTQKVTKYYSTLSVLDQEEPLFGRQALYDSISQVFAKTDSVALWGLGGIGKSALALYYAAQFSDPKAEVRKHTFWVNAETLVDMQYSYMQIGQAIKLFDDGRANTEKVLEQVNKWLEDGSNGPWIMVIDGLDVASEAAEIKRNLPEQGCGQILITTRNRGLVQEFVLFHKGAGIEVERPDEEDCMRIHKYYTDKNLFKKFTKHTDDLLDLLWFPKLIKEATNYMNIHHMYPKDLFEDITDRGFSEIDAFSPHFVEYLLEPLVPHSLADAERWPREVKVLVRFAFFDTGGIDFELIDLVKRESGFENCHNLRQILATLRNCSLINTVTQDDRTIYSINKTIQLAVLEWIEKEQGRIGLLKIYDKALSMMYRYYQERRNGGKKNANKKTGSLAQHQGSSFKYKEMLLPHFERFLAFATKKSSPLQFSFADRAVQAIILFSRPLLDQDRHGDAIHVLEYAQAHSSVDVDGLPEAKAQRRQRIHFWLGRQLVKAYISRPPDDMSWSYWEKAEKLVIRLLKEAKESANNSSGYMWAGNPVLAWEISLDLVRVYWESKRLHEAEQQLGLMDQIKVQLEDGKVKFPAIKDIVPALEDPAAQNVEAMAERSNTLKKLAIQVKQEEGLLHLATGRKHASQKAPGLARDCWKAARDALSTAELALRQSLPEEKEMQSFVAVHIAVANTKIGTREALRKAEQTLTDELKKVQRDYGPDCQRAWEMERKLNAVRLQGDKSQISVAMNSSMMLLGFYEETFGENSGPAIKCASQLREAYVKLGRLQDAHDLAKKVLGMPPSEARTSRWRMMKWIFVLFVVNGTVFTYMVLLHSSSTSLAGISGRDS